MILTGDCLDVMATLPENSVDAVYQEHSGRGRRSMTVLESLQAHPGTIREICAATGLPRREVEAEIQRLRLEGVPVITGSDGVRLSQDPEEVEACARRLRSRYVTQAVTARALRRTARRLAERAELTLWDAA